MRGKKTRVLKESLGYSLLELKKKKQQTNTMVCKMYKCKLNSRCNLAQCYVFLFIAMDI